MVVSRFEWTDSTDGLSSALRKADTLMLEAAGKDQLGKAAAKLIKSGGKRLRPALTILAASLSERQPDTEVIQAAAAVELVHLASLVHDDLVDNSPERRGRPSEAFQSPASAVLLGDYLIAQSLSLAAKAGADVALLLAEVIAEMAAGEAAELTAGPEIKPFSTEYFAQTQKKTASLFAAAAAAGSICGQLPPTPSEAMRQYGLNFGTAFQLIDDLLDGKIAPAHKHQARSEIKRFNAAAAGNLQGINSPAADHLRQLPTAYLDWAYPR